MDELNWVDVDSSNLAAVAYDGRDLHVRFHNGKSGRYLSVPQSLFDDLLSAPSKGQFHHARLVKGPYTWVS